MPERETDEAEEDPAQFAPVFSERNGKLRKGRLLAFAASLLLGVTLLLVVVKDYTPWIIQAGGTTKSTHSRVRITSNVFSEEVIANGQHMAIPATFQPHMGINEVRLIASPFPTYTCRFRWPQLTIVTRTCNLVASEVSGQDEHAADGHAAMETYIIEIPLGVDALPSDLQALARAALAGIPLKQDQVAPFSVPIGSRIALTDPDGNVRAVVATSPLVATTHKSVDPSSAFPASGLSQQTASGDHLWVVRAQVADEWQFADRSGHAQGGAAISTTATITATFHLTSSSIQFVRFQDDASTIDLGDSPKIETCLERPELLAHYLAQYGDASLVPIHEGGEQGCEIALVPPAQATVTAGASQSQTLTARFLIRFGCLLAENDQGAALIPGIPRASRIDFDMVVPTHMTT